MAKITIELDTAAGDTLQEMLAHLIVHHAPSAAFVSESVPSRLNPSIGDTGPTRDEIVAAGEAMVGETAQQAAAYKAPEFFSSVELVERPLEEAPSVALLTEYDGDRKRGTAGPNGGRRTKAQIESDTLYFDQERNKEANAARESSGVKTVTVAGGSHNDWKAEQSAKAAAALAAMEAGVHDQDDEDEAAETAQRPADAEPTLEDLRKAYVHYSEKFGTANAIRDVRSILGCGVNAVPTDKIAEALAKMQAAMDAPDINAHLKGLSAPEASEFAPTATKEELVDAMKAYAKLYDGSTKPDDMKFTKEDLPKVFTQVFGPGVTGMGSMPGALTGDLSKISPEDFGKIVTAVKTATMGNLFKRTVVHS